MQHLWNPITLSFFPCNDCPQPWRQKLSATPWEVLLAWPCLPATTLPTPLHHSAPNNGRYAIPRINPMRSCLRAFALAVSSLRKLLPGSLRLLVPSFTCLEKHSLLPHPLASLQSLPDLSSPTRSQIQATSVTTSSPDHWTAREFPEHCLLTETSPDSSI